MVTIITRWERLQMPPELEWRMWRQLRGAFGISRFIAVPKLLEGDGVEQYDSLGEALTQASGHLCFLEPSGERTVGDLPAGGEITLVLGNTEQSNRRHAMSHEMYRVDTPGKTDLYGINAAAIALAVRHGQ